MTDTSRLRAEIFERTGIAVDERDPIMAVLTAFVSQSEDVASRALRSVQPIRIVAATALASLTCCLVGAGAAWHAATSDAAAQRAEWLRQQRDPRGAALLTSDEGRAGLRLAELGVARILADCKGRRSWRLEAGYCIPVTATGQPDGFKVVDPKASK